MGTFGLIEATDAGGGSEKMFRLSDEVESLRRSGRWNPSSVEVTLVPIATAAGSAEKGDLRVARICVVSAKE